MQLNAVPIQVPTSARKPGAFEGVGGGPYVDDDEVGRPPAGSLTESPEPYAPPTGATLTEVAPGSVPWTFAALGDYGAGSSEQAEVAARLLQHKPDMLLTLGDNVYGFGLELEYRRKWDPPQLFGNIRAKIPVFPSLGNHDVRIGTRAYFRRFPELDQARYYAFERGGVQFISLDSNQSLASGSVQRTWLEGALADAKDAAFRVLYMHHPLRSSQPRSDDVLLKDLSPLLQSAKVDLVLAGHEHHYERTKALNAYGTVAVTHGGGGKEIHPFQTPPAEWSAARSADFGFVEFEVQGDALIGRSILRDGSVVDEFRVPRGGVAGAAAGAAIAA